MENYTEETAYQSLPKVKRHKALSILLCLLALAYIIIPIDYDGPWIGLIDDSLLIMAALAYCISQFVEPLTTKTRNIIANISIGVSISGIIWLCVLAFTPILKIVA